MLAVLAAAVFFVNSKKDMLVRESADFLQTLLSRETQLNVKIGKISGNLSGLIRFDDLRLEDPNLAEGLRTIVRAGRIEVRFRPWEFIRKSFRSKILIHVSDAEIYWRPSVRLRSQSPPVLDWMRKIMVSQHKRTALNVKNLTLFIGADRWPLPGLNLDYEDDELALDVPLRHTEILGNDLTTELKLRGKLEWGSGPGQDRFSGRIFTEGTVLNYEPMQWESSADFEITREELEIRSSEVIGGFELTGSLRFSRNPETDLLLAAKDYPLKNFEPFFGRKEPNSYDGSMSLEATFTGPVDALKTDAHAMIRGGKIGQGHYRAMILHATGVYPTLTLSDSHLVMEDGLLMKFVDETLEFRELFDTSTYKNLIIENAQENVSLGDWGFKRTAGEGKTQDFSMERSLGRRARVQLRKYDQPLSEKVFSPVEDEDRQDMEVGLEYKLGSENAVKYTAREDEQFVGVERKMSF